MRKDTRHQKIFNIALIAIFLGIEALVCFVPFLGSLQIGPIVATFAMVPVIIIGCTQGPLKGAILGFFAGLFSFIWWTFIDPANPSAILFTPWNNYTMDYRNYWPLVICFVPRILTGVIAGYCSILFRKKIKDRFIYNCLAGIIASLGHTLLVLFSTYLLWGRAYAELCGMEYSLLIGVVLTTITTNGIVEAAVSGVVGGFIARNLEVLKNRYK